MFCDVERVRNSSLNTRRPNVLWPCLSLCLSMAFMLALPRNALQCAYIPWIPLAGTSGTAIFISKQGYQRPFPQERTYARVSRYSNMQRSHTSIVRRLHTQSRFHSSCNIQETPYWRRVGIWKDVSEKDFLSYRWQVRNTIDRREKLFSFLTSVLPNQIPRQSVNDTEAGEFMTRDDFLEDVHEGMKVAPMSIRLTPHVLSVADWSNPVTDPIRRQFIPLKSTLKLDHPALSLDSLGEKDDSPVSGLVHRYPDKVLFLAISVCPVYCRFCTRSYAVGNNTEFVTKESQKPTRKRWEAMFQYIESTPHISDVVVSGGDSYYLQPDQLREIGERLLSIPHIRRFRFATKGLAVCPMRILDPEDHWCRVFVELSDKGRMMGKQVAMHTHFNHPNEITWATERAAQYLFERGVIVRNQSVLLRGINDDLETMGSLIRKLADLNVLPYYVYQSDMVRGVEELRTPLSTILYLERHLRGTIAGFMMPSFIVDLPGGGGKRLANSYESYDEVSGVSTWKAPGVAGEEVFTYHDPIKDGS